MSNTLHTFDYLDAPQEYPPAPVCAVFGDESFLKRLALKQLRRSVLGSEEDAPYATFEGDNAEWRDVADELSTVALFGAGTRRLVIIEQADRFVSKNRERLEEYVKRPKSTGTLVLDVETWPGNTRLYKSLDKSGLQIECRAPEKPSGKRKALDESRMCKWLIAWAKTQHDMKLESRAAQCLLEIVGPVFGLLDQDLAKLALFAGPGGKATPEMVRDIVGGWRTKTIWELMDAAADGDAGEALRQLDRLLQSGEHPVALFGQISWSLRRFAAATRIYQDAERQGSPISLREALIQAGFPHWNRQGLQRAEEQLKQLGRQRAGRIYQWLLEADLALKGSHSAPHRARFVLERLFLRMARQLAAPKARR